MPYSTCPECNCLFHLQIHGDPNKWYAEKAPGTPIGEMVHFQCFGCWKPLKELDVVEVIRSPEGRSHIKNGDVGAVVMVLANADGKQAYEVECVAEDGHTRWIETLERNQIKYDAVRNKRTEPATPPYSEPAARSPQG